MAVKASSKHRAARPAIGSSAAPEEAFAAKGYTAATVTDIAERAGVSLSTFYANFEGKEAALDAGQARLLAATLPVYRRHRREGWPQAVQVGLGALRRFMAAEPEFTQIAVVETYKSLAGR